MLSEDRADVPAVFAVDVTMANFKDILFIAIVAIDIIVREY